MQITNEITKLAANLRLTIPKNMDNGIPPFKPAKIRDAGGDPSKRWIIEYYAYDHASKQVILPANIKMRKNDFNCRFGFARRP